MGWNVAWIACAVSMRYNQGVWHQEKMTFWFRPLAAIVRLARDNAIGAHRPTIARADGLVPSTPAKLISGRERVIMTWEGENSNERT